MITSLFSLTCERCLEDFFHEGSAEFELCLHSTADVRKLAKDAGWKRFHSSDYCPDCAAEAKAAKKAQAA